MGTRVPVLVGVLTTLLARGPASAQVLGEPFRLHDMVRGWAVFVDYGMDSSSSTSAIAIGATRAFGLNTQYQIPIVAATGTLGRFNRSHATPGWSVSGEATVLNILQAGVSYARASGEERLRLLPIGVGAEVFGCTTHGFALQTFFTASWQFEWIALQGQDARWARPWAPVGGQVIIELRNGLGLELAFDAPSRRRPALVDPYRRELDLLSIGFRSFSGPRLWQPEHRTCHVF